MAWSGLGGKSMSKEKLIIGAVAGDIIGSVYEWHNIKTVDFDLFCHESTFADDSVLTPAMMDAILHIENFMMYDGRVGSGLCYLVREFCKATGRDKVPDTLAFTFGKGRTKKLRDPNDGKYQFRNHGRESYYKYPYKRIMWTIKASWLLNKALENNPKSKFNTEPAEPLRAFEAALFMMGDDLSRFEQK
jgi:hypothetical protein